MELRPHDLLRLTSNAALQVTDPPGWLPAAIESMPWVVVRRAQSLAGRIAVGVRGSCRDQRCAAYLEEAGIADIVRPEDLASPASWHPAARSNHRVIAALTQMAPTLAETGFCWGVAGAAGFELATGHPVLTETSDLDLIVRLPFPPLLDALRAVGSSLSRYDVVTDVMVETPAGGLALAELLGGSDNVLLKTAAGPKLLKRAALLNPVA